MSTFHTTILSPASIDESELRYVIIGAKEGAHWIFVRHRERNSWEMPAGHIEAGESADEAANRELYEETGTIRSNIQHLCDYQVSKEGKTESGRLYGAVILERERLPEFEIAELRLAKKLPSLLTYPEVQTILFNQAKELLRS